MKAITTKSIALLLLLIIAASLCLSACNDKETPSTPTSPGENIPPDTTNPGIGDAPGGEDSTEGENNPSDGDSPSTPAQPDGLILIKNNVAQFRVVTTTGTSLSVIREAEAFVATLRTLGVSVDDVIKDKDASQVSDCEIIIGLNAKNRPDNCVIKSEMLGDDGYVMRAVGERVIIAGATSAITISTLKSFIENQLGIKSDTTAIANAAVKSDLNVSKLIQRPLDKITVAGADILDYVIVCDMSDANIYPTVAGAVRRALLDAAGYELQIVDKKNVASDAPQILLQCVPDAGEEGFLVNVSGNNLVISCEYPKIFTDAIDDFINSEIKAKQGTLAFAANYSYRDDISTIRYSDFGAVGDGKTNDFFAIYRTHLRANETGQRVKADAGKTYYIAENWDTSVSDSQAIAIPVKTDVDWTGATFYIQDKLDNVFVQNRFDVDIFSLQSDFQKVVYSNTGTHLLSSLTENRDDLTLSIGQESIEWLVPALQGELNWVKVTHANHYDFKRFGKNQDNGYRRNDIMIVDKNGMILEGTRPVKEFKWETNTVNGVTTTESIMSIEIISVMDRPIVIEGGKFITNVYTCEAGTAQQKTFNRGIWIARSNVTLRNIDHSAVGETPEKSSVYPHSGFLDFVGAYNCLVENVKLTGYKEDIRANSTVSMGTYDLQLNTSINITFKNLTQHRDIKNKYYWGLSSSNGCKNLVFEDCTISRIDAHAGLYGLEINNCHIGQYINLVGGGDLKITNTTRYAGPGFVTLRNDYGTTFSGNIEITNCTMYGYKYIRWNESDPSVTPHVYTDSDLDSKVYLIEAKYNPNDTQGTNVYGTWDFGFVSYMPPKIDIENFTCKTTYYIFNDIIDAAFEDNANKPNGPYRITESITYKNMVKPNICESSSCTKLRAISLKQKT